MGVSMPEHGRCDIPYGSHFYSDRFVLSIHYVLVVCIHSVLCCFVVRSFWPRSHKRDDEIFLTIWCELVVYLYSKRYQYES